MSKSKLEEGVRKYFGKYLRRLFQRSPIRSAVYEAYNQNGMWSCYLCQGESGYKGDFQVEHVSPVVPPDREYVPSLEYFTRMFGYEEGSGITIDNLKLVCGGCHKVKTAEEDTVRKEHGTGRFSEAARMKGAATRARKKAARVRKPRRKARKSR